SHRIGGAVERHDASERFVLADEADDDFVPVWCVLYELQQTGFDQVESHGRISLTCKGMPSLDVSDGRLVEAGPLVLVGQAVEDSRGPETAGRCHRISQL